MDGNVILIIGEGSDPACELFSLGIGVGFLEAFSLRLILFADIPSDGEMMAKAGYNSR